jgi:DNA-binding GntR family transcriptional regulator
MPTGRRTPESKADDAYARLRQLITTCEYPPGAFITEASIVDLLSVTKTPAREALRRLVQEGLVISRPRHGYQVSAITLKDAAELFDVRQILEPAAVELAAGNVDEGQLRQLERLLAVTYRADDRSSMGLYLEANHEFHMTVVRASGNERLVRLVEGVLSDSLRLFYLGLAIRNRAREILHEHAELVDALVAGDGPLARTIASEQIAAARTMVLDALVQSPSVVGVPISAPSSPRRVSSKF